MTLTSSLRAAEFVTSIATSSAVLCFSFSAYRRTKLRAFAFWIGSCTLGIILMSAWYMRTLSPATSHDDYLTFTVIYRIIFMANSILSAVGSLMIIRHVMTEREKKDKDVA